MRISLRWRILVLTTVAPLGLALGTLWTVNHAVTGHQKDMIDESLQRSSKVFENMMAARARQLNVTAAVIVRDPRFFSVLTLGGSSSSPVYRATVQGVARDFQAITGSDLFEVFDRAGNRIVSVGASDSPAPSRGAWIRKALRGHPQSGILVARDRHFQVTVLPVLAGGRVVGALMLGADIAGELATRLRVLTQSEVTFVSDRTVTGSTLEHGDREAALRAAAGAGTEAGRVLETRGASQTYLTLVRAIPGSVPEQRQLYVLQRSLDVETAFLGEVQLSMLRLFALAVLIAILMGFAVARRITDPVQRLVRGAEEMERGNYDFPLAIRSRDEIGYLAERFHDMRQREKHYIGDLEEIARHKSEFIAIASHELRTPISIIKGFMELFSQGALGAITDDQRQALVAIERGVEQLTQIAENATRVAQIEGERLALSLEDREVDEIVREALGAAAADAPNRKITLHGETEPDLPPARVDGPRLVQAIANLVRNGIRFTPDGGSVEVRALREGDMLVFVVRDTGVGIPPDRLERVWDRSFSSPDAMHHHSSDRLEFRSAGLGLGLTMVRGIVEAHGGEVKAESNEGVGSAFSIRIPYFGAERRELAA